MENVNTMAETRDIAVGESGRGLMPWSEVCMHMQIADKVFDFVIVGEKYPMAQLMQNGREYSIPILLGEAGIYRRADNSMYYHPAS